jgi:hypothetical protein
MPWIESHTVLLRHRKVIELAKELGLKPVYVVGHLHALWHAALEQQENGDLSSWSDELIAEVSGYDGGAPEYVALLQKHGWLDGKLLHDWLDYAGNYLARKYHNAQRRKLIDIWLIHGRRYGKSISSSQRRGRPPPSPVLSSAVGAAGHDNGESALVARELWSEFKKMRARLRRPLTERAEALLLADLDKLVGAGEDARAVVEQSIKRGWQGLFPVKQEAPAENAGAMIRRVAQGMGLK